MDLFNTVFGDAPRLDVSISRKRLLNHDYPNNVAKCLEILLWGYSRDERGRVIHLIPKLDPIAELAIRTSPWPDYFNEFNQIKQLGVSTITKIAYFFQRKFGDYPALILDAQVNKALAHWQETANLNQNHFTGSNYCAYIECMKELSLQIRCTPDQLELFLFTFGRNLAQA